MARTRWQRQWTDASTGQQLRFVALLGTGSIILLDILLGGLLPLWIVFLAGFSVFVIGCVSAFDVVARLVFE